MPLYHPLPTTPSQKKWLMQLFSSQECQKNAIPPSKPPPSPPPPVLGYLLILIDEESFKKISHSLIKWIEGEKTLDIQVSSSNMCHLYNKEKTEIQQNFLPKDVWVLDLHKTTVLERVNMCF